MAEELYGRTRAAPGFSAVAVVPGPEAVATLPASIEIEFATATRLRATGIADPATVRAMIAALAKSERRR